MEVKVNVTIELGATTLAVLSGLTGAKATAATSAGTAKGESAPVKELPATTDAKAAAKAPAKSPAKAPAKAAAPSFEDQGDDEKLAAIQAKVTNFTKKGKTADIKKILAHFDVARASELSAEAYDDFYAAIVAYGVDGSMPEGEDDLS